MLVDPTATLPKETAAGLTLSVPEVSEVVVAVVEVVELELDAVVVEPPLALVTPAQPLRNAPDARTRAATGRYDARHFRLARAEQTHE